MSAALDTKEMTFVVREAEIGDAEFLLLSLCALHDETSKYGGFVMAGRKTLDWISEAIETALVGNGVALVMEDEALGRVGALVAAEIEMPYSHGMGKVAAGYGVYVNPLCRHLGVAATLYRQAKATLIKRGFDTYLGGRLLDNFAAKSVLQEAGFDEVDVTVVCNLRRN